MPARRLTCLENGAVASGNLSTASPPEADPIAREAAEALAEVLGLRRLIVSAADRMLAAWRPHIDEDFVESARNLAHYLALRRHDLAPLQRKLAFLGVSSLGRSESRVLMNVDAVAATLAVIAAARLPDDIGRPDREAYERGERALVARKRKLFGPARGSPHARIMVTLPAEAAHSPQLCAALVANGVDCARINCAHDGPSEWEAMAQNMRAAAAARGRACPILMDLGGPRLRVDSLPGGQEMRVKRGDRWTLLGEARECAALPGVVCGEPAAIAQLRAGDAVCVDDGKLGCVVEAVEPGAAVLRVTEVGEKGYRFKPGKGVNFPDTRLDLPALTARDRGDLDAVVRNADMVGYSFVQRPSDVVALQRELASRGRPRMPLVLKIETALAVENLPLLIVAAARANPVAVMVARGDLAVELGFERLAEMQEEILWLCEAARVPTIWATQVLERLIKKGQPARAETTDAAMAQRAECVMLNKGPYLAEGVRFLRDVLRRMDRHQTKKTPRLAPLQSWRKSLALE